MAMKTRIRMLAFAQLRKNNQAVPQKILLASIVEVGLAEGLEMLTVYDDRRVRYISAKGRLAVVESPPCHGINYSGISC